MVEVFADFDELWLVLEGFDAFKMDGIVATKIEG